MSYIRRTLYRPTNRTGNRNHSLFC